MTKIKLKYVRSHLYHYLESMNVIYKQEQREEMRLLLIVFGTILLSICLIYFIPKILLIILIICAFINFIVILKSYLERNKSKENAFSDFTNNVEFYTNNELEINFDDEKIELSLNNTSKEYSWNKISHAIIDSNFLAISLKPEFSLFYIHEESCNSIDSFIELKEIVRLKVKKSHDFKSILSDLNK